MNKYENFQWTLVTGDIKHPGMHLSIRLEPASQDILFGQLLPDDVFNSPSIMFFPSEEEANTCLRSLRAVKLDPGYKAVKPVFDKLCKSFRELGYGSVAVGKIRNGQFILMQILVLGEIDTLIECEAIEDIVVPVTIKELVEQIGNSQEH